MMLVSTLNRCKVGQRVYVSTREQRHAMDTTPLRKGRIAAFVGDMASIKLIPHGSHSAVILDYAASRIFPHFKSQEWAGSAALKQYYVVMALERETRMNEADAYVCWQDGQLSLDEYISYVKAKVEANTNAWAERKGYTQEKAIEMLELGRQQKKPNHEALLLRQEAFWFKWSFSKRCHSARHELATNQITMEEYISLLTPDCQYASGKRTMKYYPEV